MKKILLTIVAIAAVMLVVLLRLEIVSAPIISYKTDDSEQSTEASFDKNQHSIDKPESIWVVANKLRPLPNNYVPENLVEAGDGELLRRDAATALGKLTGAASNQNVEMRVLSGYRSYERQASVYNSYVARDGQAAADTYSARPGHSEHQTGLGVDLGNADGSCDLQKCFADTPGGKWLANNAHKFGFIVRYQKGKRDIVGYQYEPWHLRYVGKSLAGELHQRGQTMEEFFGLSPASEY